MVVDLERERLARLRASLLAPELSRHSSEMLNALTPDSVEWEILNPSNLEDRARLMNLEESYLSGNEPNKIHLLPFNEVVKEITEHATQLAENPSNTDKAYRYIADKIVASNPEIPRADIEDLLHASSLTEDLIWLSNEFKKYGSNEKEIITTLQGKSRWLRDKQSGHMYKWVDEDTHDLLQMARLVGLVPFDVIRKLRATKFMCAGASAAGRTVDLLVAMGAKDISIWDDGKISPVKAGLFPGVMGSPDMMGQFKVVGLKKQALLRNPFMKFLAKVGLVKETEVECNSENDISFNNLAKDASLVIEIVDNPFIKSKLRAWLGEHYPNLPIVFLADIGTKPIAGIEIPGRGVHFHQGISQEDFARMQKMPEHIPTIDPRAPLREVLRSVYRMLKREMPPSHTLQFIFYLLGISNAWSQASLAGAESATIATKLILNHLMGKDVADRNYSSSDVPSNLMPEFTEKQLQTLMLISNTSFAWE